MLELQRSFAIGSCGALLILACGLDIWAADAIRGARTPKCLPHHNCSFENDHGSSEGASSPTLLQQASALLALDTIVDKVGASLQLASRHRVADVSFLLLLVTALLLLITLVVFCVYNQRSQGRPAGTRRRQRGVTFHAAYKSASDPDAGEGEQEEEKSEEPQEQQEPKRERARTADATLGMAKLRSQASSVAEATVGTNKSSLKPPVSPQAGSETPRSPLSRSRARMDSADVAAIAKSTPKTCVETLSDLAKRIRVEVERVPKYGNSFFNNKENYFAIVPAVDKKVASDDWTKQLHLWNKGRFAYWDSYEAYVSKSAETGQVPLRSILSVARSTLMPREVTVSTTVESEGYDIVLHFTRERAAEDWCNDMQCLVKLLQLINL
eukprot:TRINITY_DN12648_c0_g7_i1.p1 TRINITY_DN12648_c0_g7~~TRINITY_DN12648_c0_g7_i1.p1  ORF type:complete len:383 (+),score=74.04 TRINITY_DN12648_c0_g7_i1:38-1186(+)